MVALYNNILILLGGPQGSGLESSAQILSKTFARLGYGLFADREYFSNIKGRHSYIHMRISSKGLPVSLSYPVQILCAMDAETFFTHFQDVEEKGVIVYDVSTLSTKYSAIPSIEPGLRERLRVSFSEFGLDGSISSLIRYLKAVKKTRFIGLDYQKILSELSQKFTLSPAHASRYLSSIIVGAIVGLTGLKLDAVAYALASRFAGRPQLIEHNMFIIESVSKTVMKEFGTLCELEPSANSLEKMLVSSGNDVIAMAKIVGGLRFQSYYPITPAADESFTLETFERLEVDGESLGSLIVIQTEDEIAAICSAIGASLSGVRSSTSTSGPGFSLMVEALGYAGQIESPVVITYYQRGAPSTGQPTRGGQSDLLFTLYASHGEFPRIVLSSGDHLEAFYDTILALNLSERYNVPVIHLLDKFLANSIVTTPLPEISKVKIDRGKTVFEKPDFKRFDLSRPISLRTFLGSNIIQWAAGDEHDEYGHIDEDPLNRRKMYEKRMKKLEIIDSEVPVEERAIFYGQDDARLVMIGWGSVKGVALDAVKEMELSGIKCGYLHLKMFSPFPSEYVKSILSKFKPENLVAVEHNYLAQASQLVRQQTGILIGNSIVKYTGRPIYLSELVNALNRILNGERRVVLEYGA
ncbi:MAG: 2-oxoacid:acceptor oxidoreductase subunit alpha [Nitrososphaeria archaeon]|nr:2-oxoacid:acceptor oxidoreductase subunit alpha [Nitrososphaeria archaeon]